MYIARIFFAKLMLHRSSIINKIVINISWLSKLCSKQRCHPDSWIPGRVTSSAEFAAWLAIEGQSSTANDLHGNNRRRWVSLKSKSASRAFHIAEHWTKARYWRTCTFTRSQFNVLLARKQWPRYVSDWRPVTTRSRFEIGGADQNQRGRLIHCFYINWSPYVDRTIGKRLV